VLSATFDTRGVVYPCLSDELSVNVSHMTRIINECSLASIHGYNLPESAQKCARRTVMNFNEDEQHMQVLHKA